MRDSSAGAPFRAYGRGAGERLVAIATVVSAMSVSLVPRLGSAGGLAEVFVVPELVALSVASYLCFSMAVALTRSVAASFVFTVLPLVIGPTTAVTLLLPLGALTLVLVPVHSHSLNSPLQFTLQGIAHALG